MSQVVTNAGEALFAQKAQENEQLDIDTFIFAYVPGQDSQAPVDRNEGLPPTAQQVHTQPVQQVGRINNNTVVYSTVLNSLTGPFEFNWVGLYSSVNNTLVAISHVKSVNKTITELGNAGNTLNRNFAIEYSGISDITGITVAPETWQLDFSARLAGMDALTQNLAMDLKGSSSFINEGFKVVAGATLGELNVLPGVGYVSGIRIELLEEEVLIIQSYPQNIYVDVIYNGEASGEWSANYIFKVSGEEIDNYTDSNGLRHYVTKLAALKTPDSIEDIRGIFNEYKNRVKLNYDTDDEFKKSTIKLNYGQIVSIKNSTNGASASWVAINSNEADTKETTNIIASEVYPEISIKRIDTSKSVSLLEVAGEMDAMPRIEHALRQVSHIHLVGSFQINSCASADIIDKKITGVRGSTNINLSKKVENTGGVVFPLFRSEIKDITITGSLPQLDTELGFPNPLDDSYFNDADSALAFSDSFTFSAIELIGNQAVADDCELQFINGCAIKTAKNNTGIKGHALNTGVRNCRILRNMVALNILEESEYMKFNNNSICWNLIGVNKRGGNNTLTENNIDHNRVNFITRSGANNSHGGITGGTMNHGKLAAFIADKITVGEVVSGVNIFDSGELGIYVRNSIGLNMTCNFGRTNVYCIGQGVDPINPGVNKIHNSLFNLHGANYKVYRNWNEATQQSDPSTPDNFIMRDNYLMEGQASRDDSAWDETIVNDEFTVDADGWMQQQMLKSGGDNNSRAVSGKPLDGLAYFGNGNQAGAIKVEMPVPGMNNSNVRLRLSIRTSNGLGAFFDFSAFLSKEDNGSWVNPVIFSAEGFPYVLRMGKTSIGKPLIYIGESDTVWNSAIVDLEYFSMHGGPYTLSKYWKRNWKISLDSSPMENVSLKMLAPFTGFDSDLNTISRNDNFYVNGGEAENTPNGYTGWCETFVRNVGATFRMQRFTTFENKIFIRTTTTGNNGYSIWKEI